MISGSEIRVNGQKLDPTISDKLIEARVQSNLRLPDGCLLRFSDPGLENVDTLPLVIGSQIEVLLAAVDATSLTSVFKGMVTSLEPEFGRSGTILAVRAYDGSHLLNQTKRTQMFQNMTAGDIARKVGHTAGVEEGTIDSAGPAHDFVQQNNETDWEFLWRLASRIDFEVLVIDHQLYFRKAGAPSDAQSFTLHWGEELLSFSPRVTAVQQVDQVTVRAWDPSSKQAFESTEQVVEPASQIGISRAQAAGALKGGTMVVADRPVLSQDEADELAKSYAAYLGNAYLEAEGSCKGNPLIKAGTKVKIEGIGTRYGGTYVVSATTHVLRGTKGYQTQFSTSGRSARSLVDLMTPASHRGWGNSVVIGTVTNNDDPDGLGRVRVSYPALGEGTEGWWARIAVPAAGKDRGLLMMPVVGDEVLIGFEHDDVHRPYVLGALWNGQATPGDLVQKDGSFGLQSDQKISISAKDVITIKSEKDFSLQTTGKVSQNSQDSITVEGSQDVTIKAATTLTIEGDTALTLKCGSAQIDMSASGTIQVSGTQIMLG